jgi:hypothetical protein
LKSIPEDRSYFSLSDVIIFGECPARLSSSDFYPIECQEQACSLLISSCFKWLVGKALSGVFASKKLFDIQINLLWDKLKPRLNTALSTDLLLVIKSRCDKVYNFFYSLKSFEVICHDQIFEYTSDKFVIQVPLTIIRHNNVIHTFYLDEVTSLEKLHKFYNVALGIMEKITKEFLNGFGYIKKISIIRTQNFSFHTLAPIKDLPNVVDNIIVGIKHLKYPLMSNSCKVCSKKSSCEWFNG